MVPIQSIVCCLDNSSFSTYLIFFHFEFLHLDYLSWTVLKQYMEIILITMLVMIDTY